MSFWGERRSARSDTQAVCAWSTRAVRSRASIRSSRESRPDSPRAGPMLRRVTRPCLGITTKLCRRSGFGSVPQCSHATRVRSGPTNGASTWTERTTTPALSPHDAEKCRARLPRRRGAAGACLLRVLVEALSMNRQPRQRRQVRKHWSKVTRFHALPANRAHVGRVVLRHVRHRRFTRVPDCAAPSEAARASPRAVSATPPAPRAGRSLYA